jgi:hypothetical protein
MPAMVRQVCPHLGLSSDAAQTDSAPNPDHRCYNQTLPSMPELVHQSSCCLTSNFVRCPLYSAKAQATTNEDSAAASSKKRERSMRWLPWKRR